MATHYEVLGLDPGATPGEVRRAYRRRLKATHPDVATEATEDDVRLVVEAFRTLSDPAGRRAYDAGLQRRRGELPEVPPGFRLFPRPRIGFVLQDWHYRAADDSHQALSLASRTTDLSGLDALPPDGLWKLDLSGLEVTDGALAGLRRFTELSALDLSNTAITDAGIDHLAGIPLEELTLTACAIGDRAAASLTAALPTLGTLSLLATKVTAEGIVALQHHPRLRYLDLRETKLKAPAIEALAAIPDLREVRLPRSLRRHAKRLQELRPDLQLA